MLVLIEQLDSFVADKREAVLMINASVTVPRPVRIRQQPANTTGRDRPTGYNGQR